MTLNGVIAPTLRYFTEFGSFRGALRNDKTVEVVETWRQLQKCSSVFSVVEHPPCQSLV